MKFDEMPELNKFESQMIQLNENKVKVLKRILVKLRGCNLYFSIFFINRKNLVIINLSIVIVSYFNPHTQKKKKKRVVFYVF